MKKPSPAFWLLSSTFSSLALTVIGTTSSLATEYNERFQHQRFAVEHGLTEDVSDPQALNTSSLSRPTHGSSHRESLLHTSGTHDPVTKVLKYIVEFQPNPSETRNQTLSRVQNALSQMSQHQIQIAQPNDFINKSNACMTSKVCALVTPNELDQLNQSSLAHSIIGSKNSRPTSSSRILEPSKLYCGDSTSDLISHREAGDVCSIPSSSAKVGGGSGGPAALVPTTYSYTLHWVNSNPSLYFIPDLGYQEGGATFPSSVSLSPSAQITSVNYAVGVYHDYPHDLKLTLGYDDTALGGTTDTNFIFSNQVTRTPGYFTVNGSTNYFNGLYPEAYYYIGAEDMEAVDNGYIDYIDFEVFWIDAPDLKVYTGSSSNNTFSYSAPGYLTINGSISNESFVNVSTAVDLGFYAAPKTASSCSSNPKNFSTDYFIGYRTSSTLPANNYNNLTLSSVDLRTAINASSAAMPAGTYCLWSYADDTDVVAESNETNNAYAYSTSFYYNPSDFKANLTTDLTATSTNVYTYSGSIMSANLKVKNTESTPAVAFKTAWYTTPKPVSGCSSITTSSLSTSSSYFLGYTSASGLAALTSFTTSILNINLNTITNSSGQVMTTGDYCLWSNIDSLSQVAETSESDNRFVYSTYFHFTQVPPNLIVNGAAAGTTASVTSEFLLNATNGISNQSITAVSTSFNTGWYLSPKPGSGCSTLSPAIATAYKAGSVSSSSLGAYADQTVSIASKDMRTFVLGSTTTPMPEGDYCLWTFVDQGSVIAESNESDNIFIRSTPIAFRLPDLQFASAADVTYTLDPATFVISSSAKVSNVASVSTSVGFSVNWYATPKPVSGCTSALTTNTSSAFQLGGSTSGALAANGNATLNMPAVNLNTAQNSLGQKLSSGDYCLWAFADSQTQVRESNESNNIYVHTTPFTYTRPDLLVDGANAATTASVDTSMYLSASAVTINPTAGFTSSTFDVSWYLIAAPINGCATLTNPSISSSSLLGSSSVVGLPANGSSTVNLGTIDLFKVKNSANAYLTTGDYCAWVSVDKTSAVIESNESNNSFVYPNPIHFELTSATGADLTIETDAGVLGGGSHNTATLSGRMLTASVALANHSTTDVTSSFNTNWYMVPVSAGTTTCSASLYLDTTAAYKITTTTKSSLGAGTFSDANIGPTDTFNAVNVGGVHPLSGTYCIGVSIDFDHVIHETNEANNIYFIETPIEYVSPPTGIQEQTTENLQLRLYPNPVVSTVHLEISDINSNDTAEIMIFNLAGQVASRSIEQPSRNHGNDSFELDVSNLEKGVYLVSVRQGDKVWNGKFLKQ